MDKENYSDEDFSETKDSLVDFQFTKYAKSTGKNLVVPQDLYKDWLPQTQKSPKKHAKSLDWLVEEVLEENTAAISPMEKNDNEATTTNEPVVDYVRTINVTTNDLLICPSEALEISNLIYPIIDDLYTMGQVACAALLGKLFALGIYECKKLAFMIGMSDKLKQEQHELIVSKAFKGFKETAAAAAINAKTNEPIVFSARHCMLGGQLIADHPLNHKNYPNNGVVGDVLVLTKPLGVQLALEAYKTFEGSQTEKRERLCRCVTEEDLRKIYKDAIFSLTTLNLQTSTMAANYEVRSLLEINGKSLMDNVKEIAQMQANEMTLYIYNLPLIAKTATVSKAFSKHVELLQGNLPEIAGGLLLLMPREQAAAYCRNILNGPHRAWIIGVAEPGNRTAKIIKKPRIIEWLNNFGVAGELKATKNEVDLE